jgi:hypothetical protein
VILQLWSLTNAAAARRYNFSLERNNTRIGSALNLSCQDGSFRESMLRRPGHGTPLTMPRSVMVCLIDLVTVAAGIALVGDTPVRFLPAVRSRRRRIAGAVPARLPPLRRHAPSFGIGTGLPSG